jgi:Domain of unknown function (DUF1707)
VRNDRLEVAVMNPEMRASDADRERIVLELQRHVVAGRLSLTEYSERAAAAYQARTLGELAALQRDLPDLPTQLATTAPAGDHAPLGRALPTAVIIGVVLLVLALAGLLTLLAGATPGFCR